MLPEEAYQKDGIMGYKIEEYLPPIKSMCGLCGMEICGLRIYKGGVSFELRTNLDKFDKIKEKAKSKCNKSGFNNRKKYNNLPNYAFKFKYLKSIA